MPCIVHWLNNVVAGLSKYKHIMEEKKIKKPFDQVKVKIMIGGKLCRLFEEFVKHISFSNVENVLVNEYIVKLEWQSTFFLQQYSNLILGTTITRLESYFSYILKPCSRASSLYSFTTANMYAMYAMLCMLCSTFCQNQ